MEGRFIIEGVKMADEMLSSFRHLIIAVYATEKWIVKNRQKLPNDIKVQEVQDFELQKMTSLTVANEVIILAKKPEPFSFIPDDNPVVVALDHLQDPGNLGTIIRTCDWFGIKHIICSPDTVDMYNPKVVQSAMGSLLRLTIQYQLIEDFIAVNPAYQSCVATLEGEDYNQVIFPEKIILIIGNESKGVSDALRIMSSLAISIPGKGEAESLNAAVATAILLAKITC